MRIDIDKNLVGFLPETAEEKAKVEALWKILIDCADRTRKLVPVGEYVPAKGSRAASFYIEGVEGNEQAHTVVRVERDCVVYCENCNKQVKLRAGDPIPVCCGKLMEIID